MKKLFLFLLILFSCCARFDAQTHLWGIQRSGFFNGRGKWAKGFENQMV